MEILAPISVGELIDKITILRLKAERLTDPAKLANVGRELSRLETLARGAGVEIPDRPEALEWARNLDAPDAYAPAKRPAPKPPVEHRPRELFVTRVENLTRDPYAVWARDILKLRVLDRPDETVEAKARGTAIRGRAE